MSDSPDFRRFRMRFVRLAVSTLTVFLLLSLFGCASGRGGSIPEISTLAVLDGDSDLYIAVPVKHHRELVVSLVSSQTGLSEKNASLVAGRMGNLYLGLGCQLDSGRIQISSDGDFPSFAVDMALSEGNGWSKKNYVASSSDEALSAGYPNQFRYYSGSGVPYCVSFPTQHEMLVAKDIRPLLENYALRRSPSELDYARVLNLDENKSNDILFYSSNPSRLASAIIGDMASSWFVHAEGKLRKSSSGDYLLEADLVLGDRNRKTVVMTLMALAGIPVTSTGETSVYVSGIKINAKKIGGLLGSGI